MKPHGLWLSDRDWIEWCHAEGFYTCADGDFVHLHRVILREENLLILKSFEDIEKFHSRYMSRGSQGGYNIDWPRVAMAFAGISIMPWSSKAKWSHMRWYSSWDVASVCVWNTLSAVDAVSYIGSEPIQPGAFIPGREELHSA
jgi:hypothetical protein